MVVKSENRLTFVAVLAGLLWLLTGCGDSSGPREDAPPPPSAGNQSAAAPARDPRLSLFEPLPAAMESSGDTISPAKIKLGRMLYYDARLSKNHDVACNTCHLLDKFGVDGLPTSKGHRDQIGGRNAPTVYNAAGHFVQFWDGRSPDVEDQAKGPPLNPIEMAMPDERAVVAVLESIPGYVSLFAEAFPDDEKPVSFDNMGKAIGAFERGLVTPSRFDSYLSGDNDALSDAEKAGLTTFLDTNCVMCHSGPYLGGRMYQRLGLEKSWDWDDDQGRFDVTGNEGDRQVFKVSSLRNIAMTGPYFHNGSITALDEAVNVMAIHQLDKTLDQSQVQLIVTFLESLTGEIDVAYIARPELPESSDATPAPDPG